MPHSTRIFLESFQRPRFEHIPSTPSQRGSLRKAGFIVQQDRRVVTRPPAASSHLPARIIFTSGLGPMPEERQTETTVGFVCLQAFAAAVDLRWSLPPSPLLGLLHFRSSLVSCFTVVMRTAFLLHSRAGVFQISTESCLS